MNRNSDDEFSMLLEAPEAYEVVRAGRPRTNIGGSGILRKGRSIGRRAGGFALRSVRAAAIAPLALSAQGAGYAARGLAAATVALRRRLFRAFFGRLVARRARLLAWQSRRSLRPSAGEVADSRTWAVRYVRRRGLLGRIVGAALSGASMGEPATATLTAASIPVILEIVRRALRAAEKEGAPRDPRERDGADE